MKTFDMLQLPGYKFLSWPLFFSEAFVVCLDYQPPQGFCRSMLSGLLASAEDSAVEDESR